MDAFTNYVAGLIRRGDDRYMPGDADKYAVETGLFQRGGEFIAPQLLELAKTLGDEKIISIVYTMQNPRSRHSRITRKQIDAVTHALLSRYGNAKAVYAAALGISEAVMVEAVETWEED
ncbi:MULTISPECIES: hypothetical protein [unclassified Brenneria]|uniref:hypothetical protein n=1 Tax=unclassified Brenneria TaxID=2634434 RepID=UPI0018F0A608|nr:hypothetical protein [Brenneria sp. L3-3C-1]MBJ7223591.1 hypothetical protein [Brenneria sp. L3-3C-1]MEE3644833.1 hypothetical protein [Brenneria sp. L3_3C_1]